MHPLALLLNVLFFLKNEARRANGDAVPVGRVLLHLNEDNFSGQGGQTSRDNFSGQEGQTSRDNFSGQGGQTSRDQHQHHINAQDSWEGATCTLKVLVRDALSRQGLRRATVKVYVNYTATATAQTGEDGVVLFSLPSRDGLPITLVASKGGYMLTTAPWNPRRMPIFSSITMSLMGQNKGNIWLFDDSILINAKTSDASLEASVRFPQSLLNLSGGSDVSSLTAYLTVPEYPSREADGSSHNVLGIMTSKLGYAIVELSPVAAVGIQLFSSGAELRVSGPVEITLPVPDDRGLRPADDVPAWSFDHTAGGWMRDGLGTVVWTKGKLAWTFTAPRLGYWIAAPFPSTRGWKGFYVALDYIFQHSLSIIAALGVTLVTLIAFLVMMCHCRRTKAKDSRAPPPGVSRKDQSTSTDDNGVFEVSSGGSHVNPPPAGQGSIRPEENAPHVRSERTELEPGAGGDGAASLCGISRQTSVSLSPDDGLFFCHQPVAILHVPFFHLEEEQQPEEQRSRSATLPRTAAPNAAPPGAPGPSEDEAPNAEGPTGARGSSEAPCLRAPTTDPSGGHHGLPESMSVPGTLNNKIRDKRRSCSGPGGELLGGPSPAAAPPRAWFVSLEGKPAAEVRHAGSERHRRRRPPESRDTSLDSGVDMSELNQPAGRRAATVERNRTFLKRDQQQ